MRKMKKWLALMVAGMMTVGLMGCSGSSDEGKKEAGYFKMKDLEERLEQFFFVRCHNGIIVNVDCIESLHDLTVTLYSGNKIYITRSRKQNLMKKMAERGGAV